MTEPTYKPLTHSEIYDEAYEQLLGCEELELDDKDKYLANEPTPGRFSEGDDGAWIQVWMWIPFPEAPQCDCGHNEGDDTDHEDDCASRGAP